MKKLFLHFLILSSLSLFFACGDKGDVADETLAVSKTFDYSDAVSWTAVNGAIRYQTYIPTGKTALSVSVANIPSGIAYLMLTNTSESSAGQLSGSLANAVPRPEKQFSKDIRPSRITRDVAEVSRFNAEPWKYISRNSVNSIDARARLVSLPRFDAINDSGSFQVLTKSTPAATALFTPLASHCKEKRTVTNSEGTGIILNIWVADDDWDTSGAKIDTIMVAAIADKFLKPGLDNDIYDWIHAIFGDHYQPNAGTDPDFIPATLEITILIADIMEQDTPNGGIIGYFHGLNNIKNSVPGAANSNQRIMFFIDAPMLANPAGGAGGWNAGDPWPNEIYSTLAHEFQHMIDFNEKIIERNSPAGSDTWLTEMSSGAAEDYVAAKLAVDGPRGTTAPIAILGEQGGLLPYYIDLPMTSLTAWAYGDMYDYAIVYSFAAWLMRNYGVDIFTDIVQQMAGDTSAVVDAVHANGGTGTETFADLLRLWGVSALISGDGTIPPPHRYNSSASWTTLTIGSVDYSIGSINLSRYRYISTDPAYTQDGLWIRTTVPASLERSANVFVNLPVAANSASFLVTVPATVTATVVIVP